MRRTDYVVFCKSLECVCRRDTDNLNLVSAPKPGKRPWERGCDILTMSSLILHILDKTPRYYCRSSTYANAKRKKKTKKHLHSYSESRSRGLEVERPWKRGSTTPCPMLPASVTSSQAEGRTWTENSQLIQVPAVCSKSANQFIVKVRIPCAFQKDEPTPPQAYSPSLSGYLVLFTHVKPVFFFDTRICFTRHALDTRTLVCFASRHKLDFRRFLKSGL